MISAILARSGRRMNSADRGSALRAPRHAATVGRRAAAAGSALFDVAAGFLVTFITATIAVFVLLVIGTNNVGEWRSAIAVLRPVPAKEIDA